MHASRIKTNSQKQKTYIQTERWVFFIVAHAIHKLNEGGPLLQPANDPYTSKNTQNLLKWLAELDKYSGVV